MKNHFVHPIRIIDLGNNIYEIEFGKVKLAHRCLNNENSIMSQMYQKLIPKIQLPINALIPKHL